MQFETDYSSIIKKIDRLNPVAYATSRNFIDGKVSCLSPYISRDVINMPMIAQKIMSKGYSKYESEKFVQELAWREYFQRVWQAKGADIMCDIKSTQLNIGHYEIPTAIAEAGTGIQAIDTAIKNLMQYGYMHNHARMYTASIACNVAQAHWLQVSKWMYYYLLDADLASNALSWQWVAGTFSSKKYYANQENINKYMHTTCSNTFLDKSYEDIATMGVPDVLVAKQTFALHSTLPPAKPLAINSALPTCIYNMYNLDPVWMQDIQANRVVLLEPHIFEQYPVSDSTIKFILSVAQNISGMQIAVCNFAELKAQCAEIHYKEHPLNSHYTGTEHSRAWLFPEVNGYYNSFFSYWKKCEKYYKQW
jgi:deoxyribodipyrimidine photo-lyase